MRLLSCGLALVASISLANADEKEDARGHVAKATQAHARGDFEAALAELEIAYELDPLPELLFATAQVHVRLERCPAAITYYERYLKTNPATQARLDTQQAIATCKQRIADGKRAEPPAPAQPARVAPSAPAASPSGPRATSPRVAASAPSREPARDLAPRKAPASSRNGATPHEAASRDATPDDAHDAKASPWYRDKVGGVLVASGAVAGIAALVLYSRARGQLDDAEEATTIADYRSSVSDAHGTRTLAVVFGIGSGVLLGTGVVRYALKRPSRHERRLAIVPASGGGFVTLSGGF